MSNSSSISELEVLSWELNPTYCPTLLGCQQTFQTTFKQNEFLITVRKTNQMFFPALHTEEEALMNMKPSVEVKYTQSISTQPLAAKTFADVSLTLLSRSEIPLSFLVGVFFSIHIFPDMPPLTQSLFQCLQANNRPIWNRPIFGVFVFFKGHWRILE